MPSSPPVCDEIGYGCGYVRYVRYVGSNSNLYHAFIDDMSGIQIKLNCFQHNVDLTLASSMWTLCLRERMYGTTFGMKRNKLDKN